MSGHSKWSQIKHKKGVADQKKGQLFSKLSKVISMAARRGIDQVMNIELKNAVEKAREASMPKENIERAIKRVSDKNIAQLEELTIEAVGPESLALIITAVYYRSLFLAPAIFLTHLVYALYFLKGLLYQP